MLKKYYRGFGIFLIGYGMSTGISAQDLVDQAGNYPAYVAQAPVNDMEEMAPPPSGPYQVDPTPMSASIYNQEMQEAVPYTQQPEYYNGYSGPQYYGGQMPYPNMQPDYPNTAPPPDAYYPQQRGSYGYGPQPAYRGYQPYAQPQGYPPGYPYR